MGWHALKKDRRAGLTLVELLVVIAIIAVLVALLLPVLASARQAAQRTACLGNLRQQAFAFEMFANEHNGAMPTVYQYPFPEGLGRYTWSAYENSSTWGHVGGPAAAAPVDPIFLCPAVINPEGDFSPQGVYPNSADIHYGIGMWSTYYGPLSSPLPVDMSTFADLAASAQPSTTEPEQYLSRPFFSGQAIVDNAGNRLETSDFAVCGDAQCYWYGLNTPSYRHTGRINVLLADGSARTVQKVNGGSSTPWQIVGD